jgi:DNA-binding NarL/FixJ family response regulator
MIKVLLVDDNATYLAAMRQFLDMLQGIDIVGQAANAADGLARAAQLNPDVVLLDIALPDRSGLEVARELLARPRAPQVILLTMHDNSAYRQAAEQLGARFVGKTDFVAKLLPMLERMVQARPADA